MTQRRKPRPTARKSRDPHEVVYRKPYWFDRARSLCELHGWPGTKSGTRTGLIDRYETAVNRPVGQLDAYELVTLLSQGTDPHYLVPVALDLLRAGRDPLLLRCLVYRDPVFWRSHPHLLGELLALLEAMPEDGRTPEASEFIRQHRGR